MKSGVPQGSNLELLPFLVYTNDIVGVVSESYVFMFVYNTILTWRLSNWIRCKHLTNWIYWAQIKLMVTLKKQSKSSSEPRWFLLLITIETNLLGMQGLMMDDRFPVQLVNVARKMGKGTLVVRRLCVHKTDYMLNKVDRPHYRYHLYIYHLYHLRLGCSRFLTSTLPKFHVLSSLTTWNVKLIHNICLKK